MSSSFTRLFVHLVWSTKLRERLITPSLAPRMYGALSERCRDLGCVPLAVGGVEDHVHVLVGLHPTIDVSRLVREIKAPSSSFARRVLGLMTFGWQEGYGAFSLRATELDTVRRYVLDQPQHHARGTLSDDWERDSPPSEPDA